MLSLLKIGLPGGKALSKDCKRNLIGPFFFVEFSHIVTQKCPKNLLNTSHSPSIGQQSSVFNLVR